MVKGKLKDLAPLNTSTPAGKTAVDEPGAELVGLGDMGSHIDKLKQVSATTKNLVHFLGDQLQALSATIPVLCGLDIVKELREVLKKHDRELGTVFDPLRAYIENEKKLFCIKNAGAIERMIKKRVEEGIKQKLPAVFEERLRRYKYYLNSNSELTDKVEREMATMSARTANSMLHPSYLGEMVELIPPRSDWGNFTLGDLKNIDGPAAIRLAHDQGLRPIQDPDFKPAREKNLNMILRHLGIQYQAVTSRDVPLLISAQR